MKSLCDYKPNYFIHACTIGGRPIQTHLACTHKEERKVIALTQSYTWEKKNTLDMERKRNINIFL